MHVAAKTREAPWSRRVSPASAPDVSGSSVPHAPPGTRLVSKCAAPCAQWAFGKIWTAANRCRPLHHDTSSREFQILVATEPCLVCRRHCAQDTRKHDARKNLQTLWCTCPPMSCLRSPHWMADADAACQSCVGGACYIQIAAPTTDGATSQPCHRRKCARSGRNGTEVWAWVGVIVQILPNSGDSGLSSLCWLKCTLFQKPRVSKELEKKCALAHKTHLLQSKESMQALQTQNMARLDDLSEPLGLSCPVFEV